MTYELDLGRHQTISNSNLFTDVPGTHKDNIRANVGLRITRAEAKDGTFDFVLVGPAIHNVGGYEDGTSKWSEKEIFGLVESCRKVWQETVVNRSRRISKPDGGALHEFIFQERWDCQSEPDILNALAPDLAVAGAELFTLIFERNCDERLKELGQALRSALRLAPQYIAITSNDVFLPWGMLYTHPVADEDLKPDGTNWRKEGFWGYQHVVQQTPERVKLENRIRPDEAGMVPLSINFDERISHTMKLPAIDSHLTFISGLGGKECIRRTKKTELQFGFTDRRPHLERILYFYCHGYGSSNDGSLSLEDTRLVMTDDSVSAKDFKLWSDDKPLPTSPLMFINACQGGQMNTMFYKSFAHELLSEGAVGLVGGQIDLPAVFATEYASRVFGTFFSRETSPVRLGPLLQAINRELWDTHNNPLGLVYSLYRGVDCFIDWSAA